jgi:uncharacterized protein (UPF0548 family)
MLPAANPRTACADTGCIGRSHVDDIRRLRIGKMLLGSGQRRFQQAVIAQACGSSMQRQQTAVKRKRIALVDPDRFPHLARTCSVLRKRLMMSSAFAIFFSKPGS